MTTDNDQKNPAREWFAYFTNWRDESFGIIKAEMVESMSNEMSEIKVVEKVAYEALKAERDEALTEVERLKVWSSDSHIQDVDNENKILRAAVMELAGALEKIEDPRKRDHKEPDAYTELGCVMNMATEAITKHSDLIEKLRGNK